MEGRGGWRRGGGYGVQNFPTNLSHNKSIMACLPLPIRDLSDFYV